MLLAARNVQSDRPAVRAGLAMPDAGGDFADGVIAYQSEWIGAQTFVAFDRKAAARPRAERRKVGVLGEGQVS